MRTAYSRCGRVGLDASDMGRASMPSSVFSWRKVNWVGRKTNAFGFSIRISWVEGVSGREETTGMRNPLGGSAMRRPLACSRWEHERGISWLGAGGRHHRWAFYPCAGSGGRGRVSTFKSTRCVPLNPAMENGESRGAKDTARTEAFIDGVFAFAITLLVLNLRDPSFLSPGVSSGIPLFEGLVREWQSFYALVTTLITILVMWLNHHNMFSHIDRGDRHLLCQRPGQRDRRPHHRGLLRDHGLPRGLRFRPAFSRRPDPAELVEREDHLVQTPGAAETACEDEARLRPQMGLVSLGI